MKEIEIDLKKFLEDRKKKKETLQKKLSESLESFLKTKIKESSEAAKSFFEKIRDLQIENLLREAKNFEKKNKWRKAALTYEKYIELKLKRIGGSKEFLTSLLKIIPIYIKAAECYENIPHKSIEEMKVDLKKSAELRETAAELYFKLERFDDATKQLKAAADKYEKAKMYEKAAECYSKIGDIRQEAQDLLSAAYAYDSAANYFLKANKIEKACSILLTSARMKEKFNLIDDASETYKKIADIYRSYGYHEKALEYYGKSFELLHGTDKFRNIVSVYGSVGKNLEDAGKYEEAANCYMNAFNICKDLDSEKAGSYLEGVARCYKKNKNYEKALHYYEECAEIYSRNEDYFSAGMCFLKMAEIYLELKDYEKAADHYLKYSEYATLDKKRKLDVFDGYYKAIELYKEIVKKLDKTNVEKIANIYRKMAKSFEGLGNYEKSGDFYFLSGELESKRDVEKAKLSYRDAIKVYEKGKKYWKIGKCYVRLNDYRKAFEYYLKHAKKNEDELNFFETAQGYRKCAICLRKLNDKEADAYYNKAIRFYMLYYDRIKNVSIPPGEKANPGAILRHVGECYRDMNLPLDSEKYLQRALEYFQKENLEEEYMLTEAVLNGVHAEMLISKGKYEEARHLLEEAIHLLEGLINLEYWNEDGKKSIRKYINEYKSKLSKLEVKPKPKILLSLNTPIVGICGIEFPINFEVKNESLDPVYKVSFLDHLPEGFEIKSGLKNIEKIDGMTTINGQIAVISRKVGNFEIRPLEMMYRDKEGTRYIKSSNEVKIVVLEKPQLTEDNIEKLKENFTKYIEYQIMNKNNFYVAEGYRYLAEIYRKLGKRESQNLYKRAIDYYTKFITTLEKEIKDKDMESKIKLLRAYKGLAICFERVKRLEAGKETVKRAEKYIKEMNLYKTNSKSVQNEIYLLEVTKLKFEIKSKLESSEYKALKTLFEKTRAILERLSKEDLRDNDLSFVKDSLEEMENLSKSTKY